MTRYTILLATLLLLGCFRESDVSLGGDGDESSSEGGAESGSAESAASSAGSSVSTTTAGSASGGPGSGSDDDSGSETFGGSATTTHGDDSGSSGEEITDFALAFDGTSIATSAPFAWSAQDFTVEAWIRIDVADPSGILVDQSDVASSTGWVLYIHPDWNNIVLSFFDAAHVQQIVVGPAIQELSIGWHHVAATKMGGYVWIHVDGVSWDPVPVTTTVAIGMIPISVGDRPAQGQPLTGIAIDDVRISDAPRYDADFDRPVVFDADESTVVLLTFDEGDGTEAQDAGGIDFAITGPQWVAGHE